MPPAKSTGTSKKATAKKPAAKPATKKTTTTAKASKSTGKAKPATKSSKPASKTTAKSKATATKAKTAASKAAPKSKASEQPAIELATAAHEAGKLNEALKHYKLHVDKYPKDTDSHLAMGDIYLSEGEWDDAIESFESAYSLAPEVELGYKLASLYQKAGYNSKALNLWTALLAKTRSAGERHAVLVNLVHAYLKNGQAEPALRLMEREGLDLPFQEAIACMLTHNGPRALHLLQEPQKAGLEPFRRLLLGVVYYASGQTTQAIEYLNQARRAADMLLVAPLLAHAYALDGQPSQALSSYVVLPAKSRDGATALNMGALYLQCHQPDEAVKCFEQASKTKALALDAAYGLAQSAVQQADWPQALKAYDKLIKQFPSNPDWLYQAGLAAYHAGVYHQAIEYWVNALELAPNRGDIFASLGHACYQVQAYDRALSAYQEATSRGVQDASLYLALGHAYLTQHAFAEAAEAYELALNHGADSATVDRYLAQARHYAEVA